MIEPFFTEIDSVWLQLSGSREEKEKRKWTEVLPNFDDSGSHESLSEPRCSNNNNVGSQVQELDM